MHQVNFELNKLAPIELSSVCLEMNQIVYTEFESEDILTKNDSATFLFLSSKKYLKKSVAQINDDLKTAIVKFIEKVSQASKKTNRPKPEKIKGLKE